MRAKPFRTYLVGGLGDGTGYLLGVGPRPPQAHFFVPRCERSAAQKEIIRDCVPPNL